MRWLITICTAVALAAPAQGQLPSPAAAPKLHSLSLEAKSVATGGAAHVTSGASTSPGTARDMNTGDLAQMTVTNLHQQNRVGNAVNLALTVRNLAMAPDTATLEWYFFAYPVGVTAKQNGGKETLYDYGSQSISIAARASNTLTVSSKEAQSVTTRTATAVHGINGDSDVAFPGGISAVGTQSQSGWIMKGWSVRLVDAGHIIATCGSSQNYEDIAKDETKLKALGSVSSR